MKDIKEQVYKKLGVNTTAQVKEWANKNGISGDFRKKETWLDILDQEVEEEKYSVFSDLAVGDKFRLYEGEYSTYVKVSPKRYVKDYNLKEYRSYKRKFYNTMPSRSVVKVV